MAALELDGITKRFGDVEALRDVSFALADGRLMVLLGPSGAGKTTMLKVIAGLQMPDWGEVRIGGQGVNAVLAEKRNVAVVFESYALYPNMTVFENLAFPLRAPARGKRLSGARLQQHVRSVAAVLGIDMLLDRRTWQLSGGQKQRVALGRALVRRPALFLMDEPISHLDAKLRFQLRAELKRLQRDIGITTLFATPDYAEAMAMADVIAVLREGRIVQVGSPPELFSRPRNTFVAYLLGEPHINLIDAELLVEDGYDAMVGDGIRIALGARQAAGLRQHGRPADGRFLVGVRPADLVVSPAPAGEGAIPAAVLAVEPRGSTTVLILRCGSRQLAAKLRGRSAARPGDAAWLTADPSSLLIFGRDGNLIETAWTNPDRGAASP